MRRWYIPTRTSSWSYNTICFCLSGWGVHMNILCTTSGFLYQKLGHHFPCFVRNDMGFPCWFFLNGLFGQGPQLLIPGGVFKRFIPTLGKTGRLQLAGWLTPQQKASGPQLSGRTALCSAGRSSGSWAILGPQEGHQWDDSANRHYVNVMIHDWEILSHLVNFQWNHVLCRL